MPSSLDFKDQLKQQADIVRIIGEYVKLRKSGAQNFQGLCPFHKEKTPSFSVHATRGYFHCFGCGESGRRLPVPAENRRHHVWRSDPRAGLQARRAHAEDAVRLACRGPRGCPAREIARHARARLQLVPGAIAQAGSGACPRVSCGTWLESGDDRDVSYWLRAGIGIPAERSVARRVRR